MLSDEAISTVVLACILFLSEILPFFSNTKGNGLLHSLALVAQTLQESRVNGVKEMIVADSTPAE